MERFKLLALCLLFTFPISAQTTRPTDPDVLRIMVDDLRRQVEALRRENAELRRKLAEAEKPKAAVAATAPAGQRRPHNSPLAILESAPVEIIGGRNAPVTPVVALRLTDWLNKHAVGQPVLIPFVFRTSKPPGKAGDSIYVECLAINQELAWRGITFDLEVSATFLDREADRIGTAKRGDSLRISAELAKVQVVAFGDGRGYILIMLKNAARH